MPPTENEPLRERKRRAAMVRIQGVALDLFEARGFDAVPVEEIAAASDVSPSSVYRYFGTKEDIVLWDEVDLNIDASLARALAGPAPLAGLRRVALAYVDALAAAGERRAQRRATLMMVTPALEQATAARTYAAAELLQGVIAERMGRPVVDLEVQVLAHALTGALLGAVHHWCGTGFAASLHEVAQEAFDLLERGLGSVTSAGDS